MKMRRAYSKLVKMQFYITERALIRMRVLVKVLIIHIKREILFVDKIF